MPAAIEVTLATALPDAERSHVEALAQRAEALDGFAALNEAAWLHLRHPRPRVQHLLAGPPGGELLGYAQLETGPVHSTGHLVVAPEHRRRGIGSALLGELLAVSPVRVQLWAVGDTPAAAALARAYGLLRVRELLIMIRHLTGLAEPEFPAGVSLRTFRPAEDADAWLRLNARAFADHPEQGSLTADDLAQRMAEPWFDPAGFLLAERAEPKRFGGVTTLTDSAQGARVAVPAVDTALVGFHWTKQHAGTLGEVYVLGVDPAAGGRGLGRALLLAGLRHLAARGNRTVELYVEADHARAVALYTGHGFTVASRDVMYAQP